MFTFTKDENETACTLLQGEGLDSAAQKIGKSKAMAGITSRKLQTKLGAKNDRQLIILLTLHILNGMIECPIKHSDCLACSANHNKN